jgi:hypothetical protein
MYYKSREKSKISDFRKNPHSKPDFGCFLSDVSSQVPCRTRDKNFLEPFSPYRLKLSVRWLLLTSRYGNVLAALIAVPP